MYNNSNVCCFFLVSPSGGMFVYHPFLGDAFCSSLRAGVVVIGLLLY